MDSKDSGSDAGGEEEEPPVIKRSTPTLQAPDPERSPRLYGRGLRKPSYIAPIEEEIGYKFEEEEEKTEIPKTEEPKTEEPKAEEPPTENVPSSTTDQQIKEMSSDTKAESDTEPTAEEQKRKLSEPQEFSRFRHVDAGDLVSSEGGNKVVSALEFQSAELKAAKKRYQSLSAEDIPTWVAQEKPQPVISARGDVTFEYKSRLPSIKAFIRREANELATFLKGQQQGEEQEPEPVIKPRNCPLFSIRPPTLDLPDHQLFSKHFPMEEPTDALTESKYRYLYINLMTD